MIDFTKDHERIRIMPDVEDRYLYPLTNARFSREEGAVYCLVLNMVDSFLVQAQDFKMAVLLISNTPSQTVT